MFAKHEYGNYVLRGYPVATVYNNNNKQSKMAFTIGEETVAFALQQLSMSPEDQEGLTDFLLDYFGSTDAEELGKQMNKLCKFMTARWYY